MRKNIKLLTITFVLAMQSLTTWSGTTSVCPVFLYYRQTPLLGGNPKPSKAPANLDIPLNVTLNEEDKLLCLSSQLECNYCYYIYNESDNLVSSGILDFINCNNHIINLSFCDNGTYTLVVIYNGHAFSGSFAIYSD